MNNLSQLIHSRRYTLLGGDPVARIRNSFKNRIAADSGIFEAESCLDSEITRLRNLGLYDKASLILTPNAYKAGKLYALKPNNGSGDLTLARAGVSTRRNAVGTFDSLAINVPSLTYPIGGGCPSFAILPQRTNIFLNPESPVTQNITVTIGQIYTVTTFGTVTATCSGAGVGVASNNGSFTFTASTTTLTVTISGLSGQAYVNCGLGGAIWYVPIMSGASATTRMKDTIPPFNASSYIGASSGTFYFEFLSAIQPQSNSNINISLGSNSDTLSGNQFWIRNDLSSNSYMRFFSRISGSNTGRFTFTQDRNKLAVAWNGTTATLYVNGDLISTFAWTETAMNWFSIDPNVAQLVTGLMFFPNNLTNAELGAITTI